MIIMRILHTSDWHLGQFFFNKSRFSEHQKFIIWLLDQIQELRIDALIIAGDVFDTGSPPSYARELYNSLVIAMKQANCQLVILAGNHDSVSTLNESKNILAQLNTQVISSVSSDVEKQVIELYTREGELGALLCAIPYIRPRDVVKSRADKTGSEKQQALGEGIANHYQNVFSHAVEKRKALNKSLPIIATGHLTAMGVTCSESVRDIYVGNLEGFPASAFPQADYIALGHIHRPQVVAKNEYIRYSGSPIALSFDELTHQKQVLLIEFNDDQKPIINAIEIPRFQPMQLIKGDLESIERQLQEIEQDNDENRKIDALAGENEKALATWLSIEVESQDYLNDLQVRIQQLSENLNVEVLQLRRARKSQVQQIQRIDKEVLDELTPFDVFERRLSLETFDTEKEGLRLERIRTLFSQVVAQVNHEN